MGPDLALLHDPVLLVLHALAVFRLSRLAAVDVVLAGPRDRLVARLEPRRPLLAYLVSCVWCLSVWVAVGWFVLAVLLPTPAAIVAVPLAWSAAAGLLAQKG